MTLPIHSARYKYQCLNAIKARWLKNPHKPSKAVGKLYDEYMNNRYVPDDNKDRFHKTLVDFMSDYLIKYYENLIEQGGEATIKIVEKLIERQVLQDVFDKLMSAVDIWKIRYAGPVYKLRDINSSQSVHANPIIKTTNDGVATLLKVAVPEGQKTIFEIEKAWSNKNVWDLIRVMGDIKEWGSRKTVMGDQENVYRNVLRGLWAHIKTIADVEMKAELINRLWEECKESVQMCADGHVARLVNVMVGFDERFGNNVSPMEYFQNNIALIAAGDAPQRFKIEQATKLMDYVNMPKADRDAWLEAF
jgi:hypothetical protein